MYMLVEITYEMVKNIKENRRSYELPINTLVKIHPKAATAVYFADTAGYEIYRKIGYFLFGKCSCVGSGMINDLTLEFRSLITERVAEGGSGNKAVKTSFLFL